MKGSILCDADFLISLHVENESTHQQAILLYDRYVDVEFFVLNLTLYEIAIVLSKKYPHQYAGKILDLIKQNFPNQLWFSEDWEEEAYDLFTSFEKKNISFFDCACMVSAKKINAKIASFDSFYAKELRV